MAKNRHQVTLKPTVIKQRCIRNTLLPHDLNLIKFNKFKWEGGGALFLDECKVKKLFFFILSKNLSLIFCFVHDTSVLSKITFQKIHVYLDSKYLNLVLILFLITWRGV